MRIKDFLSQPGTTFSFEFFPPKNEVGWKRLYQTIDELKPLNSPYVSITYGAGGSTQAPTHDLVVHIHEKTDWQAVSHLTTVGSNREQIQAFLQKYSDKGVCNILALRGDPPKGQESITQVENGFPFAADLVAFIRERFPHFGIGAAGFPEGHPVTPNRLKEIEYLKAKVDAGVDYIVTQLFFDNRDYYDFCERCSLAGINVPIVAGILPITSLKGLERMAELAYGSRIPARLLKAAQRAQDDAAVTSVGVHWAAEQVDDLVYHNVPGIHIYTLNQSHSTLEIFKALGVRDAPHWAS